MNIPEEALKRWSRYDMEVISRDYKGSSRLEKFKQFLNSDTMDCATCSVCPLPDETNPFFCDPMFWNIFFGMFAASQRSHIHLLRNSEYNLTERFMKKSLKHSKYHNNICICSICENRNNDMKQQKRNPPFWISFLDTFFCQGCSSGLKREYYECPVRFETLRNHFHSQRMKMMEIELYIPFRDIYDMCVVGNYSNFNLKKILVELIGCGVNTNLQELVEIPINAFEFFLIYNECNTRIDIDNITKLNYHFVGQNGRLPKYWKVNGVVNDMYCTEELAANTSSTEELAANTSSTVHDGTVIHDHFQDRFQTLGLESPDI